MLLKYGNTACKEYVQTADPGIFDIFSFPIVQGSTIPRYTDPHVLVISKTIAEKYFRQENPVGKVMTINNEQDYRTCNNT